MPRIETETTISAPIEKVFDLARSIDAHKQSQSAHQERAVAGRTSGLIENGEVVTWEAVHFGVRQRLTSKITAMNKPTYFRDSMVSGAFKRIDHDHFFEPQADGGTKMKDVFDYVAPLGPIGLLVDWLILEKYMRRLLETRNQVIKRMAEATAGADRPTIAGSTPSAGRVLYFAALLALTIGGLVSVYQLSFCLWMCAYHTDQLALSEWHRRLYVRLATTVTLGILWITASIGLYRRSRRRRRTGSPSG